MRGHDFHSHPGLILQIEPFYILLRHMSLSCYARHVL
jgi:hypothetical protein